MTDEDEARRMRIVPSTNPDGLDLTIEQARAMSREEFGRLFGYTNLDEVPLVGPGFLDRAPRDCKWYVRFRPKPKNPGAKDRKQDGFELVVKRPKKEGSADEDAEAQTGGNPKRVGLLAKRPDAARLEALVWLARKAGRRRRASTWPIERIQSLLCAEVIRGYMDRFLADPVNRQETKTERATRITYRSELNAFVKAFPELEIGDIDNSIAREYDERAAHRSPTTRPGDLSTAKRALNEGLRILGVPPTYVVNFKVPQIGMLPKVAWTPEEYDRVCAAADGWLYNPDGSPKMVPGPNGRVQGRRPRRSVAEREAWRRAILFLPYTGNRNGLLPPTRWVPPEIEPADGKLLEARPWIEVAEDEVIYHSDGESRYDGKKRRGGRIIPEEAAPVVRGWFAEDLAKGFEFVFHKPDGTRYEGKHLSRMTFKRILVDAAVDEDRVPHHFKDLCVQWADEAGLDRDTLAIHIDTTPKTIARKYGDAARWAKKKEAAKGIKQAAWRQRGGRKAKVTKLFEEARDKPSRIPEAPAADRAGRRGPRVA